MKITQEMKDRITWLADTTSSSAWETARMKQFAHRILNEFLPEVTDLNAGELKAQNELNAKTLLSQNKTIETLVEALEISLTYVEQGFPITKNNLSNLKSILKKHKGLYA